MNPWNARWKEKICDTTEQKAMELNSEKAGVGAELLEHPLLYHPLLHIFIAVTVSVSRYQSARMLSACPGGVLRILTRRSPHTTSTTLESPQRRTA